jgi:hypothetical protein
METRPCCLSDGAALRYDAGISRQAGRFEVGGVGVFPIQIKLLKLSVHRTRPVLVTLFCVPTTASC